MVYAEINNNYIKAVNRRNKIKKAIDFER